MFADDFVGLTTNAEDLQTLINIVQRYDFKALLRLVKSFILLIWDTRKNKLYGDQDGNGETSGCFCSCPLTGDLSSSACVCECVVNGVSATAATQVNFS